MKILKHIEDIKKDVNKINNLGLVPTMGGLHKGHLSLIKESKRKCKKTLVTIFINPRQFNRINDFKKYPRQLDKDIVLLKKLKVNFLFLPDKNEIYKNNNSKKITLKKNEKILCAKFRNGHFEGVLNVMNRLMTIIKSKDLYMGEKDYQQLFLIKKFLSKKFKVRINSCPTIRINNKIALSTRNKLLNKRSFKKASEIASFLKKIKYRSKSQASKLALNLPDYKKELEKKYKIKIDYLEFRDEKNLKLNNFKNKYRLFVAYNIDNVRLIDNY